MTQISVFDRIPPNIVYRYNPDHNKTFQTQGLVYCSVCGRWLGCGGMLSWRLTEEEMIEQAKEEWISTPNTPSGFCECGAYVWGEGTIYKGVDNGNDKK